MDVCSQAIEDVVEALSAIEKTALTTLREKRCRSAQTLCACESAVSRSTESHGTDEPKTPNTDLAVTSSDDQHGDISRSISEV